MGMQRLPFLPSTGRLAGHCLGGIDTSQLLGHDPTRRRAGYAQAPDFGPNTAARTPARSPCPSSRVTPPRTRLLP